jgi:hypothetical protein
MTEIKKLTPGVPEGAVKQTQHITPKPTVLVSEYTRRVAHELDNLRGDWLIAVKGSEITVLNDSPYYMNGGIFSHLQWLTDYDNVELRYAAAGDRISAIQQVLNETRTQKTLYGQRYPKSEYHHRRNLLKKEFVYLNRLRARLKIIMQAKVQAERRSLAVSWDDVAAFYGENPFLECMVNLRDAVHEYIRELEEKFGKENVELPDNLKTSLYEVKRLAKSYAREHLFESKKYALVDGIVTSLGELYDSKNVGTGVSEWDSR